MNLPLVFLTRNDICAVMMFIESDIASVHLQNRISVCAPHQVCELRIYRSDDACTYGRQLLGCNETEYNSSSFTRLGMDVATLIQTSWRQKNTRANPLCLP
jgi:hypothetical protein